MQKKVLLRILVIISLLAAMPVFAQTADKASEQEPELVIVKYGSVEVKSAFSDAKVYIDDAFSGRVNSVIDSILVGGHKISCQKDDKTVSGEFIIKKNETLRLEARFDSGKMVNVSDIEKAETDKKKKEADIKTEADKKEDDRRKRQQAEEKKEDPQKNAVEDRRSLHLNIIKISFEDKGANQMTVGYETNKKTVSRVFEKKNVTGKLARNKSGMLMCGQGPCVQDWSASFTYSDETGKSDSFVVIWKNTYFEYITPFGLSKSEVDWCLNGICDRQEERANLKTQEMFKERFTLTWSKSGLVIRRTDIMKEIIDSGARLSDY